MKKNLLILFLLISLASRTTVYAQTPPPQIAISDLKDQTVNAFTGGAMITQTAINADAGFIIKVSPATAIKAMATANAAGKFVTPINPQACGTGVSCFTINKPPVDPDAHTVSIRLYGDPAKTDQYKTLTLTVSMDAPVTPATPPRASFNDILGEVMKDNACHNPILPALPKDDCSVLFSKDNLFGEKGKKDNYDKHKVLYIYNFDPKSSEKLFYKIYLNPATKDLAVSSPVNFNTERIKANEHIQFKIVNINRYMYDISVNHSFTTFDSQPSALFNGFFTGDNTLLATLMSNFSSGLTSTAATTTATSLSSGGGDKQTPAKPQFTNDDLALIDLLKSIRCFLYDYNALNARILQAYNPCSVFPCCQNFDYQPFANRLTDIKLKMAVLQNQVTAAKTALAKTTADKAACDQNTADLKTATTKKAALDKKDPNTLSADDKKSQSDLATQITNLNNAKCSDDKVKSLQTTLDAQTATVQNLAAIIDIISKLPSESDLKKMTIFLNNMVQSNELQVINEENITGNRLDVTIDIKAKDSLVKYLPITGYHETTTFHIPVILKPFVSFSSGSFMAVGNNLKNKTYDWQQQSTNKQVSDTSHYFLAESGYTGPVLGFSALGNIEWKLNTSFGIGASAGAGITIEKDPRPSYLLGGSLFFGNERQFAVTGGLLATQVDVLDHDLLAAYQQRILYTNTDKPTVTYYKELHTGIFISLTFTPFTTSSPSGDTSLATK